MGKTAKPTVAGILSTVAGGLGILGAIGAIVGFRAMFEAMGIPVMGSGFATGVGSSFISLLIAVLALVGGIFTLQRQRWGWSLAGSIAAIFAMFPLGVVATILTGMSKKEYDQPRVQLSAPTVPSSDTA
jgi:hypothetical protein